VGTHTTFTAGTTAVAADVNTNFAALKTAINDNIRSNGNGNTIFGLTAGNGGLNNTAFGANALSVNAGNGNIAVGGGTLVQNTSGATNTALGFLALPSVTTGSYNIGIGIEAGTNLTTGGNNIAIGSPGGIGDANTIRIGAISPLPFAYEGPAHTRAFIAGVRGVTTATAAIAVVIGTDGQLGTLSSSRRVKDDIADMGETSNVLMKLRPVTFHYKADKNPQGRTLQYGLIAEEVQKIAPGLVARNAKGEIETVFYQHLAPMLLNEYQKQQHVIEIQAVALAEQKAALAQQTARMAQLEQERQTQTARLELLEQQATNMAQVLGRLERSGMLTTAGR